jgi:hypothetical protein
MTRTTHLTEDQVKILTDMTDFRCYKDGWAMAQWIAENCGHAYEATRADQARVRRAGEPRVLPHHGCGSRSDRGETMSGLTPYQRARHILLAVRDPQRITTSGADGITTLPQADPNGLFSPAAADGTWVLCLNPRTRELSPLYVEPRIISSPFPLDMQ